MRRKWIRYLNSFRWHAMWGKQILEWFSQFKGGEISVEDCQFFTLFPHRLPIWKHVKKVHKICKSLTMYPLGDGWQLRLSYGKLQRISKGPTEHATYIRKVCSSAAHRWGEAAVLSLKVTLYSDMAPCDFFLFPRMKSQLTMHHLQYVPNIQEQSLKVLHVVPKCEGQQYNHQQNTWRTCRITSKGVYFKTTWTTNCSSTRIFPYRLNRLSPVNLDRPSYL
jgi:hypothetical protein